VYEVIVGPLAPGGYDVWVGHFNPTVRAIEVPYQPVHIEVKAAAPDSSATEAVPDSAEQAVQDTLQISSIENAPVKDCTTPVYLHTQVSMLQLDTTFI
jgi:hypothetical protein